MFFNDPKYLNEDGTLTINITPSQWRAFNIEPDTYELFNNDLWVGLFLNDADAEASTDLWYDDFNWVWDKPRTVRMISEKLTEWIENALNDLGVPVIRAEVVDTWSPDFYNFTSDGFTIKITLDPQALALVTPQFDVYKWVEEHYSSSSGFISFVPARLEDEEYRDYYDATFRIEYLFYETFQDSREWVDYVQQGYLEEDIYDETMTVTPEPAVFLEEDKTPRIYGEGKILMWNPDVNLWVDSEDNTSPSVIEYHRKHNRIEDFL